MSTKKPAENQMAISIKNIRVQLHLSLEQLAAYLGVTRSRVHQFESGVAHESGKSGKKSNTYISCCPMPKRKR
ncbi:MAG: helix-turn-helix transcriptional regulator [Flavobacteriales bacterium]|nr:helix-turn-helix transcriptional regulator [Flavobacteriales bacterium]